MTRLTPRAGPLGGVVVVEVGSTAAEYAGRLLGELGALVIKVEPPTGSPSRARGPFALSPDQQQESSLGFWARNVTKLSLRLDLEQADGQDVLRRLVQRADVVLEGRDEGPEGGLDDLVRQWNVGAVHAVVSPFGTESPWRDVPWSELTALALGGIAGVSGYEGDDETDQPAWPIAPAGNHATTTGGVMAVIGIVSELLWRSTHGEARHVEVALHDALAVSTEFSVPAWSFGGKETQRHTGRHASPGDSPIWNVVCGDGKFFSALPLYLNDRRFGALLGWLQSDQAEEDLGDPIWRDGATREARMAHIMDVISRFCLRHTSEYIFHEAQARGLAWSPIQSPDELVDDEYLHERGFFVEIDMPPYGPVFFPGVAYKGLPSAYDDPEVDLRPAHLGQDSVEVLDWLGLSEERITALTRSGVV